jgi:hypothetical protein
LEYFLSPYCRRQENKTGLGEAGKNQKDEQAITYIPHFFRSIFSPPVSKVN